MASVHRGGDEAVAWKTQIRQRVMSNLEEVLKDAHHAYMRKISDNPFASPEIRQKLHVEYNSDVQTLRHIAEEDARAAIAKEDSERKLVEGSASGSPSPEHYGDAFVEEQVAILNTIRAQVAARLHRVEEYNGSVFQQGSSSSPLYSRHSTSHATTVSLSSSSPSKDPMAKAESAADRQARLQREQHEKKQDEFRKRAEEIQDRKRRERQQREQLEWTDSVKSPESMSCSSSNTSASDQDKAESVPPMSEEDVINLMIFHDQQWTHISSLLHLQWGDFPWPFLSFSEPRRKEDLSPEAVAEYVYAPFNIHHDRAMVKEHLKNLIRRWHPDRFEVKYLARIADLHERELIRECAGVVARILNDLLGKWNE